jgi:hypothetical protein
MVQIAVSDDLARAITEAGSLVMLVDSRGQALGQITPIEQSECPHGMTIERWNEIKRRMENPGDYSTLQEIKERLGWVDQQ